MVRVLVATCWGVFLLVWVAGALYNESRGPRTQRRIRPAWPVLLAIAGVFGLAGTLGRTEWRHAAVGAEWVRALGLALLVASTVFVLWARAALGTMWSMSAEVKDDHRLRTHGPYAVTRHPIYTGLLGMLLGTALAARIGPAIVIVPVAVVVLELKIRMEERLMAATFPGEYERYRAQVPQLVPGWLVLARAWRRARRRLFAGPARSRA